MPDLLREFELQQVGTLNRPRLKAGDIVRVEMKIKEADKTRLQAFEGTVLGIRGSGPSVTFTVRHETGRFGVERVFPLYNPLITNIEVLKRQKVRRAKLTYLREAARRRVKEDERSMQRLVKEEADKKRLAAEAKKREEEEEIKKLRNKEIKKDDEVKADETKEPTVESDKELHEAQASNEQEPSNKTEDKSKEKPTAEAQEEIKK